MNTRPSNSKLSTPFELPGTMDQDDTKPHFRRRDVRSTLLSQDLEENHSAFRRNSDMDATQNPFPTESEEELVEPGKRDVEIVDPKRDFPDKEFPEQEEEDEEIQTPEKVVFQTGNYFLTNEEGDLIKGPEGIMEDSYLPKKSLMKNIVFTRAGFSLPK